MSVTFRAGACALLCVSSFVDAANAAGPPPFQGLGIPVGSTDTEATAISADGSTAVGFASASGVKWTAAGGSQSLTGFLALGVNDDGSIVVGQASNAAVMWTGSNPIGFPLAELPSTFFLGVLGSEANGISGDGSKIVGFEIFKPAGGVNGVHPILWTGSGAVATLLGSGSDGGVANAISTDGSTIVGQLFPGNGGSSQPFYWRNALDGTVAIPNISSTYGQARAVNADGTVIVGGTASTNTTGNNSEAFRWDATHGTVALGDLAGGDFWSMANAVDADGTVVVGFGTSASGETAVRWDSSNTIATMADYLAGQGIDVGAWSLRTASGISADGKTIVGAGDDPAGNDEAWIARIATSGSGLLGLANFTTSLTPALSALGTGTALTDGSVRTAQEIARDYGCGDDNATCIYGMGGIGTGTDGALLDPDFGLIHGFRNGLKGGAGISISARGADIDGGSEDTRFADVQGFMTYDPEGDSLTIDAAFSAGVLGVDTTRSYLNGATNETATGSTSGDGESASIRFGWQVPTNDTISFTPFVGYSVTHTALNGYTETSTGPFPATFSARSSIRHDISLGTEARVAIDKQTTLTGSLAWRHSIASSADPLMAAVPGVLTAALPANTGAGDELDLSAAMTRALSPQATFGASLAASFWETGVSAGAQAGFSYKF